MKKIHLFFLLIIFSFIFFNGVNKNNAIVWTGELDIDSNYQTWQDLDLSAYTSSKLGKCLLYCEILSGDEGVPSEMVRLYFKPKGANVTPEITEFMYGGEIGVIECWTDDYGILQWYSNYGWPENKTVIVQIKIMININ